MSEVDGNTYRGMYVYGAVGLGAGAGLVGLINAGVGTGFATPSPILSVWVAVFPNFTRLELEGFGSFSSLAGAGAGVGASAGAGASAGRLGGSYPTTL